LKREILREAFGVAADGLVEDLGRHFVERGEVAVEDNAPSANVVDGREVGIGHGRRSLKWNTGGRGGPPVCWDEGGSDPLFDGDTGGDGGGVEGYFVVLIAARDFNPGLLGDFRGL
jgi:hypothetical protein